MNVLAAALEWLNYTTIGQELVWWKACFKIVYLAKYGTDIKSTAPTTWLVVTKQQGVQIDLEVCTKVDGWVALVPYTVVVLGCTIAGYEWTSKVVETVAWVVAKNTEAETLVGLVLEGQTEAAIGVWLIYDVETVCCAGQTTHSWDAVEGNKLLTINWVVTIVIVVERHLNTGAQVVTNVVMHITVLVEVDKWYTGFNKQSKVLIVVIFCLQTYGRSYVSLIEDLGLNGLITTHWTKLKTTNQVDRKVVIYQVTIGNRWIYII